MIGEWNESSLVDTLLNGIAQRLERWHRLVYADRSLPALAAGRCESFSRLPSHVVARHVARLCPGRPDAPLLDRAFVESADRSFEDASLDLHRVADNSPHSYSFFLGSDTGDHGNPGGYVLAEISATHGIALATRFVLCGVCRTDDLDVRSFHVSKGFSRNLKRGKLWQ